VAITRLEISIATEEAHVTFLRTRFMGLIMSSDNPGIRDPQELVRHSSLYREFQAEREEILRHKWIESEKAGYDIGFERALTDWILKHRRKWRKARHPQLENR
jgi:hypothetical protein